MTNETEESGENAGTGGPSQSASMGSLSQDTGGSPEIEKQPSNFNGVPGSNSSSLSHDPSWPGTAMSQTSTKITKSHCHGGENGEQQERSSVLKTLNDYLPKYGFKVDLDHRFPKKWDPYVIPPLGMVMEMLLPGVRYLKHFISSILKSKKPFIDLFRLVSSKCMYGVPLGGIGCGTIGRGFRGEFCRFQMTPGNVDFNTAAADQFILTVRSEAGKTLLQKVLSPSSRPKGRKLSAWDWQCNSEIQGRYCGLYPRSWTVYDIPRLQLRLILRQVSPVIPGEYKDSCLPVGVFVWTVENSSSQALQVSICNTFKNGTGGPDDVKGSCWSETRCGDSDAVMLHHTYRGADVTYCLAAPRQTGVKTSVCLALDPNGNGAELWKSLQTTGQLQTTFSSPPDPATPVPVSELAVALNCEVMVPAGGTSSFETALSWDMPVVSFKARTRQHKRRYTRWFSGTDAAAAIASYALQRYRHWETQIDAWQSTILDEPKLPEFFKSALFNQLYYVADGGTVWLDVDDDEASSFPSHDPRLEYGRFAYLESHEYRMYNTYDVHFYASWALVMLWPELQRVLQYDMAMFSMQEDTTLRTYIISGNSGTRKAPNTVPHDIGDPEDEPFSRINAYIAHDVKGWRDLNLKFILQVYRDFKLFGSDMRYLKDMWQTCVAVMESSSKFDTDGDGLIENSGTADQTFDTWVMHGPSAYCCSLWLAALGAMEELADVLGCGEERTKYAQMLTKAQTSMEKKLWNGSYYNFDSCDHPHHLTIMSDQLVGHWYLSLSGNNKEVFKKAHVVTALKTMYEQNVMKFCNGNMGAVNGMKPDGEVDCHTVQSQEMWPGTAFALAATFIKEGMLDEGFRTAEGIYNTTYYETGLAYDMPEALYATGHYRAVGYMRPLSVWSMYRAWCLVNNK
ncbi:non-lysosomal glucosylceramidase isoform X2 [Hyalella azteca]|uniref:Non-lysosomal glucosylceramidase n=1 Tax=Hyalella azteca TaxID=294128 RepID=A0A8B7N2G6_HYAAZ|nr:non-lysosomal glucosylceramidase isoform X1 [Hyalella azteca]XP_047736955.1 non-lysosomal glucosylceramidase isoform X2 [Hyalella azteca]